MRNHNNAVIICPICGDSGKYIFKSRHEHYIYQCLNKNCGHFWVPKYKNEQLLFAREENLVNESNNNLKIFGRRNEKLLNLILKNILVKKEYKFLDYGSGCAHVSRSFKKKLGDKVKIYCFDSNQSCKKFYPQWDLISIDDIKQIKEKIDLIYLIEVIEHLENPYKVLCNLKGMLNNNGVILISTPPGQDKDSEAYVEKTHIQFFTNNSLNLLLDKVGLTEIQFRYFPEFYPSISLEKKLLFFTKKQIKNLITFKFSFKDFIYTFYSYFLKDITHTIFKNKKMKYPYHLTGFTKIKLKD